MKITGQFYVNWVCCWNTQICISRLEWKTSLGTCKWCHSSCSRRSNFMHIKKGGFDKQTPESIFNSLSFADTCTTISIRHLQAVFYLLMLGYILALVCFVAEIMWHCYRSKGRGPVRTSLCHRWTKWTQFTGLSELILHLYSWFCCVIVKRWYIQRVLVNA